MDEERIIELESRVAYQSKLLSELDEVVRAFAERVERAERKIQRLETAQQQQRDVMEPHNTPPPHY